MRSAFALHAPRPSSPRPQVRLLSSSATVTSTVLVLAVGLAFVAAPAAAQGRAAVVSMGGSAAIDASIYARAVELFEQRLHAAGFEVDTTGTPRVGDGCHRTCRDEERRARELELLLVLTLEADASGAVRTALVSVLDALSEYTVREDVGGRDPVLVAELAAVQALARRERGLRPWISVTGTPEAAYVSIDGRDVGLVPWEGEVAAGEHELAVHLPGYAPFSRTITAAPGAPVDVEVELERAGGGDDTRHVVPLAIGIPLVAAGVVLLSMGGAFATRAGECTDPSCSGGYVFGDTEGATIGVGVSSIVIGGVLVFVGAF